MSFGANNVFSGYGESLREPLVQRKKRPVLWKCHTIDSEGRSAIRSPSVKVVYTIRQPHDAIASAMMMFGWTFETALQSIGDALRLYSFLKQHSNLLVIPYGRIMHAMSQEIQRIACHLDLTLSVTNIEHILATTSFERTRVLAGSIDEREERTIVSEHGLVYDRETLLHRNHIQNGGSGYGSSALDAEQCRAVDSMLERVPFWREMEQLLVDGEQRPKA